MEKATLFFFFSTQLDFNDTNYTWHALCVSFAFQIVPHPASPNHSIR